MPESNNTEEGRAWRGVVVIKNQQQQVKRTRIYTYSVYQSDRLALATGHAWQTCSTCVVHHMRGSIPSHAW